MSVDPAIEARVAANKVKARRLAYISLGLTLTVALLTLASSLRGQPVPWPQLALLITLFCTSIANFVSSRPLKRLLAFSGLVFAAVAIYGFLKR